MGGPLKTRVYSPRQVSDKCVECGNSFTYSCKGPHNRRVCGDDCNHARKARQARDRASAAGECIAEGCARKAVRVSAGMCEAHYTRTRRKGHSELEPRKPPYVDSHGYVNVRMPEHPLSGSNGYVRQHRLVAYERHGDSCSSCHWCGIECTWADCHVDHVNGIKDDNRGDNLVISCARCNRMRGAAWGWLLAMTGSGLDAMLEQLNKERKQKPD